MRSTCKGTVNTETVSTGTGAGCTHCTAGYTMIMIIVQKLREPSMQCTVLPNLLRRNFPRRATCTHPHQILSQRMVRKRPWRGQGLETSLESTQEMQTSLTQVVFNR